MPPEHEYHRLKVVAVVDATQNFGSTQRAINFYDVTNLSGGSVFGQTPLFSVWPGYEMSASNNFEETDTIAVNPANGRILREPTILGVVLIAAVLFAAFSAIVFLGSFL